MSIEVRLMIKDCNDWKSPAFIINEVWDLPGDQAKAMYDDITEVLAKYGPCQPLPVYVETRPDKDERCDRTSKEMCEYDCLNSLCFETRGWG